MADLQAKLLIIGGGPGGYVAAIRAGQLGVDTVLVEKDALGGACLNVGCIPSKALIHAADEFYAVSRAASGTSNTGVRGLGASIDFSQTIAWKDGIVRRLTGGVGALLKKAGVKVIAGQADVIDGKTVAVGNGAQRQVITAETLLIASGATPIELPFLPFGGDVLSSAEALALTEIPRSMAIVGAGYIGLEIGCLYAKLGATITLIEAASRILPHYDEDLTKPVSARLKQLGVDALIETHAKGRAENGCGLIVEHRTGEQRLIEAEKILVAVGRKPALSGWGVADLGLAMNGPYVQIDDRCRTSMRGVYAIGDITGEPMLAHRAMAQGEMVAEIVAGLNRNWDKRAIPAICFTDPEIVSVGLSPDEARASAIDAKVGLFPFRANGRAMTIGRDDGFVRIVARSDNDVILGIQAVGAGVSELAASFGLALEMGCRLQDIAGAVHAHPSLGEAVQEASFAALGRAMHMA
ncbi:dihydrolipoamide dehydrogenase [Rhizobium sp. SG_E_25_P2]|uniref:dihydrolipoyl dehydrogenase n=1 Tax=Rhizobium sp. SG_E_25_P2 TaxID=2879942 RepID=UPI002474A017|nr:dihydrolipoyl dehydrogenase [Rhizobium sp. SG_E_25_P2]MDH6265150.1 dihydrolipoamide dehydrogenase [Rhizobium sp. SG_E_25_P2]